ncbi:MAG: hypothetical protein LBR77_08620 [Lachnospiraceae bacterium]|jgi:hypothetical protein|nr:hypothetical protein [Lachnospiraceae bacterium]
MERKPTWEELETVLSDEELTELERLYAQYARLQKEFYIIGKMHEFFSEKSIVALTLFDRLGEGDQDRLLDEMMGLAGHAGVPSMAMRADFEGFEESDFETFRPNFGAGFPVIGRYRIYCPRE